MVETGHNKAYINVSVAPLRAESRHASEQVSQLMMGDSVKVFERGEAWHRIEAPDGYQGYVHREHILEPSEAYERLERGIVTAPFQFVIGQDGNSAFDVSMGCIVGIGGEEGGLVEVFAPDMRYGLLYANEVMKSSALSSKFDKEAAIDLAASLNGVPYLWGGTTPRGLDCSGLIQLCGRMQGYSFPRDAKDQAVVGKRLEDHSIANLKRGDLLFFGEGEKITHVALYEGDSMYWHASGRVRQNSLNPSHPLYDAYRFRTLKWAMRLD